MVGRGLTAGDLWDQVHFAVGTDGVNERVLKDLAVDGHRHALVDLFAKAWE